MSLLAKILPLQHLEEELNICSIYTIKKAITVAINYPDVLFIWYPKVQMCGYIYDWHDVYTSRDYYSSLLEA